MALESIILSNLLFNEKFGRKVIPFLKKEYFTDYNERIIFEIVDEYVAKYNNFPSLEALSIELSTKEGLNEQTFEKSKEYIKNIEFDETTQFDWLVDNTEKFCQEKALYNAIMQSIKIIDDNKGIVGKGAIPQILSDALAISFDTQIGHDFLQDHEKRYDFYHLKEDKIPFDLEYLNKITSGGLSRKTLNLFMGGTGLGKTLVMCHFAASNLIKGYNVLYITMEMAEERIAERIDANLLDLTIDELKLIPKESYSKKIKRVYNKTKGKLIIKEYPTASAGSANFRHLLGELRIKKNFVPDIIYIDYINICASSRIKNGSNVNSYILIKTIAEELRGLSVEFNVPIVSATQTTRSGFSNSDLSIEDISESFGLAATCDLLIGVQRNEQLDELNQILFKQLKNRYSDLSSNRRFVIGVDRSKMKLYDCEEEAQEDLVNDTPVMNNTKFVQEDTERTKKKFDRSVFDSFS